MRVLVTGAQGTLGRPLVRELRMRGHDVHTTGRRHSGGAQHVRADIAQKRQLDVVFEASQPDVVYHLAAEFGRHNGEEFYETLWLSNVIGTRNVLECCEEWGSRMIFASSSEVYGEGFPPGMELSEELLLDEVPVHSNEYAISKYTNELQIRNYVNRTGLRVTVLRFFNAYGPGEEYHPYRSVVALFVHRALTGEPWDVYEGYWRTFMHIDDFIPTLANVCERNARGVYNIGGRDFRSVKELSDIVISHTGADPSLARMLPEEKHNVMSKIPSIARAQAEFGHDPKITLNEGIPGAVEWARGRIADGGCRQR